MSSTTVTSPRRRTATRVRPRPSGPHHARLPVLCTSLRFAGAAEADLEPSTAMTSIRRERPCRFSVDVPERAIWGCPRSAVRPKGRRRGGDSEMASTAVTSPRRERRCGCGIDGGGPQARFGCARSAVLPSPRGWLSRSSSRVPSGTRVRRERRCGFGIDARDGGDVRLPALFGSLQDAGEAGPHEMQSTVTSSRHDRRRRSASTVQTARFGCPALWLSLQSAREAEALPSAPPALDEVPMPTAMGPGRVLPDLCRVLESGPRPRR